MPESDAIVFSNGTTELPAPNETSTPSEKPAERTTDHASSKRASTQSQSSLPFPFELQSSEEANEVQIR